MLLTCNISQEVGLYVIRVLIHFINMVHEAGRKEILQAYIKVEHRVHLINIQFPVLLAREN